MIRLIPTLMLPGRLAKGRPGARYRGSDARFPVRRNVGDGGCSMKIPEDVRPYAAAQGLSEEKALGKGMEEKSKEFADAGAEFYAKA